MITLPCRLVTIDPTTYLYTDITFPPTSTTSHGDSLFSSFKTNLIELLLVFMSVIHTSSRFFVVWHTCLANHATVFLKTAIAERNKPEIQLSTQNAHQGVHEMGADNVKYAQSIYFLNLAESAGLQYNMDRSSTVFF